jgi:hypothetical protein
VPTKDPKDGISEAASETLTPEQLAALAKLPIAALRQLRPEAITQVLAYRQTLTKGSQRGRPHVFGPEYVELMSLPSHSARWNMEHAYAMQALQHGLTKDPRFTWLCEKRGEFRYKRYSLLAELGRVYVTLIVAGAPEQEATALMQQWAEVLCRDKPTVKDGQRFMRMMRRDLRERLEALKEQHEDEPNGKD